MLMHMLNVGVGMTFSGGIIDLVMFGILPGASKTSWYWIPVVGAVYFVVYFFLFRFLILKFDLKTPGRDDSEEVKLYRRSDVNAKKQGAAEGQEAVDERSQMILNGLGGKKNVVDVDCCITRLRCTVSKPELVNEGILKKTGAAGVIKKGQGIQVIYGPTVPNIKADLVSYMATAPDVEYHEENDKKTAAPESSEADTGAGKNKGGSEKKAASGKRVPLYSPFNGKVESIEHAPDVTFAQKMIGDGFMVMPANGEVLAPCDLDVAFVFPTGHAVGLKTADGTEFMLHIGVDTVKLEGKGFEPLVKDGDHVKRGQKLMQFDLEYVKNNAVSEACMVIYTALPEGASVEVPEEKEIKALDHAADLIGV